VWIYPTVKKRVNARAAYRYPQTDEKRKAVIFKCLGVRVEISQHVVQVKWHPANGKNHHHGNQKLDALSFGANLSDSLVFRHVS
jgi:hypothetical protein